MNSAALQSTNNQSFRFFEPGHIIGGCYKIIRSLGGGNTGAVYLCSHVKFPDSIFAMKILPAALVEQNEHFRIQQRFENEAKSTFMVHHENVVSTFAFFKEQDFVAFSMEYVEGGDLAQLMAEGPISPDETLRIITAVCRGLTAIHEEGIIHRDLKPENLLLALDGEVKITDFGIARMDSGQNLTAHGSLLGTMDYLSPEYLLDGNLDERADIYALGMIGYEMLTGRKPFKGGTMVEALKQKLNGNYIRVEEIVNSCPLALSRILDKALARDPNERYQTAEALLEDLERLNRERIQRVEAGKYPVLAKQQQVSPPVQATVSQKSMTQTRPVTKKRRSSILDFFESVGRFAVSIVFPQQLVLRAIWVLVYASLAFKVFAS